MGVSIKASRGKVAFTGSVRRLSEGNGLPLLLISVEHGEAAGQLAWEHSDPFDRILGVLGPSKHSSFRCTGAAQDPCLQAVSQIWPRLE
jgi:PIN domain nuclease of toxin-antitoxin system